MEFHLEWEAQLEIVLKFCLQFNSLVSELVDEALQVYETLLLRFESLEFVPGSVEESVRLNEPVCMQVVFSNCLHERSQQFFPRFLFW